MSEKIEILKKKILYRASYRGTKEMDILLTSFVKKHINQFDETQLNELEKFLQFEDEVILNYYNFNVVDKILTKCNLNIFKVLKYNGGEGGIEPTNELPRCWFQDQCFQRSTTSPKIN